MKINNLSDQPDILRAALVGYQIRQEEVEKQIREVKGMLAGKGNSDVIHAIQDIIPADYTTVPIKTIPVKTKRNISAAARERIAAATRLRWKRYRREKRKAA